MSNGNKSHKRAATVNRWFAVHWSQGYNDALADAAWPDMRYWTDFQQEAYERGRLLATYARAADRCPKLEPWRVRWTGNMSSKLPYPSHIRSASGYAHRNGYTDVSESTHRPADPDLQMSWRIAGDAPPKPRRHRNRLFDVRAPEPVRAAAVDMARGPVRYSTQPSLL